MDTDPIPNAAQPKYHRRRFHLTPDRLVIALLALVGFLYLSEKLHWFAFIEKKGWAVLIAVASVGAILLFMLLWFAASLVFHWRFQFSIRSLLVLVVVVAIPCSWLAAEVRHAEQQRRAAAAIWKLGGQVGYDFQQDASGDWRTDWESPEPVWSRNVLNVDFFADVTVVSFFSVPWKVTDAGLENLDGLTALNRVYLDRTQITDAGLKHLKALSNLKTLHLRRTQVSDAGAESLHAALPNCWIDR